MATSPSTKTTGCKHRTIVVVSRSSSTYQVRHVYPSRVLVGKVERRSLSSIRPHDKAAGEAHRTSTSSPSKQAKDGGPVPSVCPICWVCWVCRVCRVRFHLSIEQNGPLVDDSTSQQNASDASLKRHQTAPKSRPVRTLMDQGKLGGKRWSPRRR